jgi:hypothetical protein
MAENSSPPGGGAELFTAWMKHSAELWSSMTGAWLRASADSGKPGRMAENLDAALHLMQTMLGTGPDLKMWENVSKLLPDMSLQLFQRSVEGYAQWSQRWGQRLATLARKGPGKPYDFDEFDRDFINRWSDIYQEEFRRYFHVPQLGLGKFYQEKAQQLTDAYNVFQTALLEFLNLLAAPVEKAARVMQHELAKQSEKGTPPKESKAIYAMWIKILEGHFMTLFKSADYTAAMSKTLAAANHFAIARQRVTEDWLRLVPAPTMRDLDELAQEVYGLKKRVLELERRSKRKGAGPAD